MALEVRYRLKARKQQDKLPFADAERIERRLDAYAADPDGVGHDVLPYRGHPDEFRLRSGDWRIIFERHVDHLLVVRVSHRREAYR